MQGLHLRTGVQNSNVQSWWHCRPNAPEVDLEEMRHQMSVEGVVAVCTHADEPLLESPAKLAICSRSGLVQPGCSIHPC